MSERRKPILTLHVRERVSEDRTKIEIFEGSEWEISGPASQMYRVRENGRWHWPRRFMTRKLLLRFLANLVEDALDDARDKHDRDDT